MKLQELMKKFAGRFSIRVTAGVLAVIVFGSCMGAYTIYAKKDTGIKQETVYFISDANGTIRDTIVVDHLLNTEGAVTIEDMTTLAEIQNVNGREAFTQSGESLIWQADGSDIYYQGKTSKEAPVTQKVTYYLDGKEMKTEDIAGKSGQVTVRFNYTNNTSYVGNIDGTDRKVKVPLAAVTVLMLDDSFSNVSVTNGKAEANGNNVMVIGYALPGMKESLGIKDKDLDDDVDIPEYFEMTADVENFELSGVMTIVANASELMSSDKEGVLDEKMEDMDKAVDDLTEAADLLEDGSGELADGSDTLKSGVNDFTEGTRTLKEGVTAYTDGVSKLTDGIAQLSGKTPELSDGVGVLNSSASSLYQGISLLDATLNTAFTEKEQEDLQKQVYDMVAAQEMDIKNSARYSVESQADTIRSQAEAAVDVRAETIKAQAVEKVNSTFSGGQYAAIQNQAAEQVTTSLTSQETVAGVTDGIRQTDAYYYIAQGIRAVALQQVIDQSGGQVTTLEQAESAFQSVNGISINEFVAAQAETAMSQLSSGIMTQIASNVSPMMGKSVADTALLVAENIAQEAALSGAKEAAGTAAVSAAAEAAGTAAYEGAKGAAGMAALSAAEQTKMTIAGSIEATADNGYSLVTGMKALSEGTQNLQNAMPELLSGISQLNSGSQELAGNNNALNDGAKKLFDGAVDIADGVKQLNDGTHELFDGMTEFNEEGIGKIAESYNGDMKDLMDNFKAMKEAGKNYQTFTSLADGTEGGVKFIYKLDEIKVDE